eukprot:GHVT01091029.1.p2 GENE.GHVT01091029.1~~GHVT01091029.1.p2  ORF type:complete len:136 (-),score=25.78 GHVT01091029.1:380-787(-)
MIVCYCNGCASFFLRVCVDIPESRRDDLLSSVGWSGLSRADRLRLLFRLHQQVAKMKASLGNVSAVKEDAVTKRVWTGIDELRSSYDDKVLLYRVVKFAITFNAPFLAPKYVYRVGEAPPRPFEVAAVFTAFPHA